MSLGVSADVRSYLLSYPQDEFTLQLYNGVTTIDCKMPFATNDNDTLNPALPVFYVNILIGMNDVITGYVSSFSDSIQFSQVNMACNEVSKPTSQVMRMKRRMIVSNESVIPSVDYIGTFMTGCYQYATFRIAPFGYNAIERSLCLVQSVDIDIIVIPGIPSNMSSLSFAHSLKKELITNLVVNPTEFAYLYSLPNNQSYSSLIADPNSTKYLIITNNVLKPVFQRLADWKTKKGVKAQLITVEDIYNTYSDSTNQLKIKRAIRDIWINSGRTMQYVLIGGDQNVVPVQECYVKYGDLYSDIVACDVFYSCLDDMNWDKNSNGVYGELEDSISLLPDVISTRITASTITEADVIVQRILDYERYRGKPFHKKMLLSGCELYETDTILELGYNHLRSDAEVESEDLYINAIQPYWSGDVVRFYDTWTDYPENANYNITPSSLEQEIEKGYAFFNMSTHGLATGWETENGSMYAWQRASMQQNQSYTLVTTNACFTNKFIFEDNCLSEALLKNPTAGIIGYLGSSAYGWVYYSNKMNEKFYSSLFQLTDHGYGKSVLLMKALNHFCCHDYSPERWLQISLNPLGDPEMPIFIEQPQQFSDDCFVFQSGTLNINTNVDSSRVCIMSNENAGLTYYNVIENVNQNYSINNLIGCYSVCVTRPGFKPKIARVCDNAFVQNEIIDEDITFLADFVRAGSHVTNNCDYGPVVISNGKVKIKSNNGVLLDKGFSINKGAELIITH